MTFADVRYDDGSGVSPIPESVFSDEDLFDHVANTDPRVPVDPQIESSPIELPDCLWSSSPWDGSRIHKSFRDSVVAGCGSTVLHPHPTHDDPRKEVLVPKQDLWENSFLIEEMEKADNRPFPDYRITWAKEAVNMLTAYPTSFSEGSRRATHFFIRALLHSSPKAPATWGFYFRWLLKIDFKLVASYESISWGRTYKTATLAWECKRTGVIMVENISEQTPIVFSV